VSLGALTWAQSGVLGQSGQNYLPPKRHSPANKIKITVGDSGYLTLAAAVGTLNAAGTDCWLIIPKGSNETISAKLTANSNIFLEIEKDAIITQNITPAAIAGLSRDEACVVTWTNHGLATGDVILISGIAQPEWIALNDVHAITYIDTNSFSVPVNTSGYTSAYNPGTDPGSYNSTFRINGSLKGEGTVAFATNNVMSLGSGSKLKDVNFTGIGYVALCSVSKVRSDNCYFNGIDNGYRLKSTTGSQLINQRFDNVKNIAFNLYQSNNNMLSGTADSPSIGAYLEGSSYNDIKMQVSNATQNAYYLHNGSNYNRLECYAYNSHNYNFSLQTNCNYNRLISCVANTANVDENYNIYNSHYNTFIGCLGYNAKLNCFESAGGSCNNSFIACESWGTQGHYGFALIAEVDGGGAGAACNGNSLVACKTDGGSIADYFIGSATYSGFCANNSVIGCYGFSKTKPNLMLRNDINTNTIGNYLYNKSSFADAFSVSPDSFAGRRNTSNIFPNLSPVPPFTDVIGGGYREVTNGGSGYAGSTLTDGHFGCNAAKGGFGIKVLSGAHAGTGRELGFTKIDSSVNAVTIQVEGGGTINGHPAAVLTKQWDTLTIKSDGTNWIRIK